MIINSIGIFRKPKHLLMGAFLFSMSFGVNFAASADAMDVPFLTEMASLQSTNLVNLKNLTILPEQLEQLKKSLTQLDLQNKNLTTIQGYMTGDSGFEDLLNGNSDMNARLWSNDKWSDVLQASGGTNTQGFTDMQKQYSSMYPVVDKDQIGGDDIKDTDLIRAQYEQQKDISRAALAASAYSYNTINQHMQNIKTILANIKNTQTEKASMDMNARLLAEVSYIQLEMLKNQDMQTQLMATQSQGQVNGMSDEARFSKWNPSN